MTDPRTIGKWVGRGDSGGMGAGNLAIWKSRNLAGRGGRTDLEIAVVVRGSEVGAWWWVDEDAGLGAVI
jgi:hypothetical protein